jgi:hypothetical protein
MKVVLKVNTAAAGMVAKEMRWSLLECVQDHKM